MRGRRERGRKLENTASDLLFQHSRLRKAVWKGAVVAPNLCEYEHCASDQVLRSDLDGAFALRRRPVLLVQRLKLDPIEASLDLGALAFRSLPVDATERLALSARLDSSSPPLELSVRRLFVLFVPSVAPKSGSRSPPLSVPSASLFVRSDIRFFAPAPD